MVTLKPNLSLISFATSTLYLFTFLGSNKKSPVSISKIIQANDHISALVS